MIDIEGLGVGPDATILTIAAQSFDPLSQGWFEQHYYARVTLESQDNRSIDQSTIEWWATQDPQSRDEAFNEHGRVPLTQALEELGRLAWQHKRIWANGPTYDMNILEHAYKSQGMKIPWQFFNVRDARTVYSLWPALEKPPVSHHALEDCRRQIVLLQKSLGQLGVVQLK